MILANYSLVLLQMMIQSLVPMQLSPVTMQLSPMLPIPQDAPIGNYRKLCHLSRDLYHRLDHHPVVLALAPERAPIVHTSYPTPL
jgi:hypothetical protein